MAETSTLMGYTFYLSRYKHMSVWPSKIQFQLISIISTYYHIKYYSQVASLLDTYFYITDGCLSVAIHIWSVPLFRHS